METFNYSGYLFSIKVEQQLPEEGYLSGLYGILHYRHCNDGYTIIDSSFLGSGFVCWPTSAELCFPSFINDIPVTEIHNHIEISSNYPISVEGGQLKRVYLHIGPTMDTKIDEKDSPILHLVKKIKEDFDLEAQKSIRFEISIDFCNNWQSVDFCEIYCDQKIILNTINAAVIRIVAPITVLKGPAYHNLEHISFSGKVYPDIYSDWHEEVQNTEHFSGCQKLRFVEGSLSGDTCWSFDNCISLEKVHLSNGMTNIPPYSFRNCCSLVDLYIPDTVSRIESFAFSDCANLKTIHLPSSIDRITEGMFKNCRSLVKCFLPDSIQRIENEAFYGCRELQKPWISEKLNYIGENAFNGCSSIKEIFLPEGISFIGNSAFNGCGTIVIHAKSGTYVNRYAFENRLTFIDEQFDKKNMDKRYDLSRFTEAQKDCFRDALQEITNGHKETHWMWFIFPQIHGLGHSNKSQYYALESVDEARAFLKDPYLGQNLTTICRVLLQLEINDPHIIFGYPDDMKLRSCMTLFAYISEEGSVFHQVLIHYYKNRCDEKTLKILNEEP